MKYGFPKNLIEALVCQKDGGLLAIREEKDSDTDKIHEGALVCKDCETVYPVQNGIVNLLGNQSQLDDSLAQEIKARDVAAPQYNTKLQTRYEKEVPSTIKCLGNYSQKNIIEYGSGTGRITQEIVKAAKKVLAIDFSYESLLFASKNIQSSDFGLVLADITQLRTKNDYFDMALSTQCFEHIPNNQLREFHIKSVRDTLRSGGLFISSVYHHDMRRRLKKLSQEGTHGSGIYYYYYRAKELSRLHEKFFTIEKIHPIDITLPFEARFSFSPKLKGKTSRVCENIPILNSFGHLLLLKCKKE